MKVLQFLDNTIANALLEEQKENVRHKELESKLSGSILGQPLQAQVLHMIGTEPKQHESYVLRKFQRGHHVEEWIMKNMIGLVEQQTDIVYRGATGHIDALVDMASWDEPQLGVIPHEVKSITNAAYKWINKTREAKWSHKLQAGMYALALGAKYYMIHYVASDDYRILSMLYKTADITKDINDIITEVHEQLALGIIPAFVARENWQENKEYQNYPTWSDLTSEQCMEKIKEYPESYKRLLEYKKGGDK